MERTSVLYRIRRKCQVFARYVLPNELLGRIYSRIVMKKDVDISNPKTFNEKIQWLKLYHYPSNPLVIKCTDKYTVRSYIKEKGYEELLVPLLGCWDTPLDIDWDKLPERFVLKCNHGCAYNIVCNNKENLDIKGTQKKLANWLKEDFGAFNLELHYSKIAKRLITAEEFLGDCIQDYKFFCFNGEPKFFYISNDLIHDRQAQIGFFDISGKKIPLIRNDYKDIPTVELPEFYEKMINAARALSQDFLFVRVDFFLANDRFYFAELTFTPSAGMMPISPRSYDVSWGDLLDISKMIK